MKTLLLSIGMTFLITSSALAQDSTRLTRYEYVVGATLAYSLIDYYGFNIIGTEWHAKSVYRVLQVGIQTAITYFLYKELGLTSAISFNLIWWTWGTDLTYYGWANALNSFAWEGRKHTGLMSREIDWAGWTPIGLLRPRHSLIARDALVAQAIIGFSVSMAILW
jgi:hypothetical protein